MSVSLRLALVGKRNHPIYRVVVTETRSKRNGKFIEQLGTYNANINPPVFTLNREAFNAWVKKGAIVSTGLTKLLKKEANRS